MSEWQPIETAPNSRLILAWMDGFETHSGADWRRSGYELITMHDGAIAQHSLRQAKTRIIGESDDFIDGWFLRPVYWAPLPEPPEDV